VCLYPLRSLYLGLFTELAKGPLDADPVQVRLKLHPRAIVISSICPWSSAYEALPKGGALIVYEHLIDDDRRKNMAGLLMSLIMLLETQGSFDYPGADCQGWMREAGFKETYVEELTGIESMVVGIK